MYKLTTILMTVALLGSPGIAVDCPHWGGGLGRNMVNPDETNIPTTWDVKSGKNIKWVVPLGSLAYGNPVVAGGRIFVGTNNDGRYDKAVKGDSFAGFYQNDIADGHRIRIDLPCFTIHLDIGIIRADFHQ